MEEFTTLLIPALLGIILVRALLMPIKLAAKLAIHAGCGFLCLWLLNTASGFTGVFLPINAITVLLAGTLGLPGIALIVWLEIMT